MWGFVFIFKCLLVLEKKGAMLGRGHLGTLVEGPLDMGGADKVWMTGGKNKELRLHRKRVGNGWWAPIEPQWWRGDG